MKKKLHILTFLLAGACFTSFSQDMTISGVNVYVSEGINVAVEGKDVVFENKNGTDGIMHLNGTLKLTGSFINNNVSLSPIADPENNTGFVIFNGNEDSDIISDKTIEFHNLTIDKEDYPFNLPAGLYIIRLTGNSSAKAVKIVIN